VAYLDTSALVPLVIQEPASLALEGWFDRSAREGEDFVISDWCLTEFASVIGIKLRSRHLDAPKAQRARALMKSIAQDVFRIVPPRGADFTRAAEYLDQTSLGLRAGDALHLAIAVGAEAGPVVTLDKTMLRAARRLGLDAINPRG